MKACVVFCTIRNTESFKAYAANFRKYEHTPDIIVVDETGDTRTHISQSLRGFNVEFYGAKERATWFKTNNIDPQTVPPKTTDVIGFSLLIAYPRNYDMVVFVDDDTYPLESDFLLKHYQNLHSERMKVVQSENNWINPHPECFGRGYPYALRNEKALSGNNSGEGIGAVLNMGLWTGVPDLNAIDYLYNGGLQGQYYVKVAEDFPSYILGSDYFPLSRMNIAFDSRIIPAFYQWTGDAYGIGRYGDVFSGLFLSKIAKHLGDHISFGQPVCLHNKEPRDVFRDIKSEMEAIKINESMWKVLDKISIRGNSYGECYLSITEGLLAYRTEFHLPEYIDFLAQRMRDWVEAVEK